jgi:hypothetical protein
MEDPVNVRRTTRDRDGVRLCETNGTISTARSRAAARMDRARTEAIGHAFGLR